MVAALAAGTSHGLILTDDKGQVAEAYSLLGTGKPYRYNEAEDVWAFTRDIQVEALRPVLEVMGERTDKTPPTAPAKLEVAAVSPAAGQVTVRFVAPGDDGATGTAWRTK